tara:strand:+ start:512 stop:889 length:378 start_codon:yes stop_codon:yes gene_type:complete
MGRPLNKRNLGDTSGSGDQIQVSADVDGNGAANGFIVAQKGSKRFKVTTAAGTAVCGMVVTAPAAAGEMRISMADSAGGSYHASKISGRTCTVTADSGTQFSTGDKVAWNRDAAVLNESLKVTVA